MLRLGDIVGNYMHRLWLSYSSIRADASAATLSMPALRAPCMVFFIVTSDREPGSGGLAMQCVRIRHQMDCPEKGIGFLVLDAYTSMRSISRTKAWMPSRTRLSTIESSEQCIPSGQTMRQV
jgi:hypothetical protein